jgi:hypothetical protein
MRKLDSIVAQSRKEAEARGHSYREQALKMYPWVCGKCGREFTRQNLQELTVHHKDHDHDNNPEDGSNWELLCLYCHDNEHQRYIDDEHGRSSAADAGHKGAAAVNGRTSANTSSKAATSKPFANLKELLDKK